jgi:hypothetical protein
MTAVTSAGDRPDNAAARTPSRPGVWTVLLGLLSFAFLASALFWHFTLGRTLAQRLPPGWSWRSSYVGFVTYPDPKTGKFPEGNNLGLYDRTISVHSDNRPGSVIVRDGMRVQEPRTGDVVWEYVAEFEIDPATGRHLKPKYRNDYIVLPANLKQETYSLRTNYAEGIPLTFTRRDRIEGLDVFLFSYRGRGEYTESYSGTDEYEGVKVPPGHEIKCADDQFEFLLWAEPITGETVKIKEGCPSGDYVYEIATGRPVEPIVRWAAETAGIDVVRRAEVIRDRIIELRMARYMPFGLVALGLVCAAAAAMRFRSRQV